MEKFAPTRGFFPNSLLSEPLEINGTKSFRLANGLVAEWVGRARLQSKPWSRGGSKPSGRPARIQCGFVQLFAPSANSGFWGGVDDGPGFPAS